MQGFAYAAIKNGTEAYKVNQKKAAYLIVLSLFYCINKTPKHKYTL